MGARKDLLVRLLILALLPPILILATVEFCALFFFWPSDAAREAPFLRPDSRLGWAQRGGAKGEFLCRHCSSKTRVSFDENGIRRNGAGESGSFKKKLLIIGDSVSLGMEVNDDQTFSSRLERIFAEKDGGVRVINAGVRAYGADQTYLALGPLLRRYRPDIVLFMAGPYSLRSLSMIKNWNRPFSKPAFALKGNALELFNSPVHPFSRDDVAYLEFQPSGDALPVKKQAASSLISFWLRDHSFLYSRSSEIYHSRFRPDLFAPSGNRGDRVRLFRKLLAEMHKACPGLLVSGFTANRTEDAADYETFREAAAGEHLDFLDIRPFFSGGKEDVIPVDGHWSAAGHNKAALALAQALLGKGLLRSSTYY